MLACVTFMGFTFRPRFSVWEHWLLVDLRSFRRFVSVIAGQAWYSYFSKVNLLFKKSYCGMSECNCFGTPLVYSQ